MRLMVVMQMAVTARSVALMALMHAGDDGPDGTQAVEAARPSVLPRVPGAHTCWSAMACGSCWRIPRTCISRMAVHPTVHLRHVHRRLSLLLRLYLVMRVERYVAGHWPEMICRGNRRSGFGRLCSGLIQ